LRFTKAACCAANGVPCGAAEAERTRSFQERCLPVLVGDVTMVLLKDAWMNDEPKWNVLPLALLELLALPAACQSSADSESSPFI